MRTAVIIPCYNEEKTIAKVIEDYRNALPEAKIYVYDNNSTDRTAEIAKAHGVPVVPVTRQGKGAVLRTAFDEIAADYYVLVDGDDTYPVDNVAEMLSVIRAGDCDMVIGNRLRSNYYKENKSILHAFGNVIVPLAFRVLYGLDTEDIMSGSRILTRSFAKSFPAKYDGFEVETEMMIHAAKNGFKIKSVTVPYKDRPEGSYSKIHALSDGFKILRLIAVSKFTKEAVLSGYRVRTEIY